MVIMKENKTIEFEIHTLNNLIKRDIERSMAKDRDALTGVHGWAIEYFCKNRDKDVFQRDFEEHFSIRRSTATKILQLMEKNGLIMRESVSYDARLKKITLTQKAVNVHNSIISDIAEREARISEGISAKELELFFKTIDKIKLNLEGNDV